MKMKNLLNLSLKLNVITLLKHFLQESVHDGLSIEFYKAFWPLFGSLIVESFNTSIEEGELSNSQRQAVITLLDKKKDRSLIKNWRPISLLNNDYKILLKYSL